MIKSVVVILAIGGISSCNTNKNAPTKEENIEVVKTQTTEKADEEQESTISMEGKVQEINKGKDGYTAILDTKQGVYYATISIPNLKDPKQYRAVEIGETIKVTGDSWKMENDNYITVRELLK